MYPRVAKPRLKSPSNYKTENNNKMNSTAETKHQAMAIYDSMLEFNTKYQTIK